MDHKSMNNLFLENQSLASKRVFNLNLWKCKEYMTNFSAVIENVFHFGTLCTCNFLLLKFGASEGKAKGETEVTVILPSFLLKSLQFIPLLCQGRLQVQIAAIVGQLKGTVIRLDRKKTQLNLDLSSTL